MRSCAQQQHGYGYGYGNGNGNGKIFTSTTCAPVTTGTL
ncbi:hypothetical protein GLA29479_126 [Lysobacter antibioticus]|nr:hypothetical protein GLA29479_126 [Lysobacter antibioticus]